VPLRHPTDRGEDRPVHRRKDLFRLRKRRDAADHGGTAVRDHRRRSGRLVTFDPAFTSPISEHTRIIALRNALIHGYADVDSSVVWDIIVTKLPRLRREVADLITRE